MDGMCCYQSSGVIGPVYWHLNAYLHVDVHLRN